MSIVTAPRKVRFYAPGSMRAFDPSSGPTLEGVLGESYRGDDIASGGHALNLMDAKARRFVTAFDSVIANPNFRTDTIWIKGIGWSIVPGRPGVAVFSASSGGLALAQPSVVQIGNDYVVVAKCSKFESGSYTPKLGTASDGSVTGVGITVHEITANGQDFEMVPSAAGDVEFEYVYVLDKNDYRFDLALNSRMETNFAIVDGHNLLDVFPASLFRSMKLYHNSTDVFGSATEIVPSSVMAGLLGERPSLLNYNGVSDKSSIAGNALLNWGYNDGAIEALISMPDVSGDVFWVSRFQNQQNQITFRYSQSTGVLLGEAFIGGVYLQRAIASWSPVADTEYHLVWSFDRIANNLYVDKVPLSLSTDVVSDGDISVAAPLVTAEHDGEFYKLEAKVLRLWNRNLSQADVNVQYADPYNVPAADRWGSGKKNVSNCVNDSYATFDGISPTGFHAIYGAGVDRGGTAIEIDVVEGDTVAWFFDLDLAGQGPTVNLRDTVDGTLFSDSVVAVDGRNYHSATALGTGTVMLAFANSAASEFTVEGLGILKPGAVFSCTGAGLSESQGVWFDDSDNGLDAVVTGGEYRNTPNINKHGFYLIKFDSVLNDLYWSLSINEDNDNPIGLQKYGLLSQGKTYEFGITASEPYGGTLGFPGVDSFETQSGAFDVTKRYGSRDVFILPLAFLSDAGWAELQEMVKVIGGSELPFYMEIVPLDAGEVPVFYRVRMVSNESPYSFVFGNDVPWRVGLELVVDL